MVKVLQLNFRTGLGREFRISLENPKEDLTSAQVLGAMNTIINNNVFNVEGGLAEALSASIVSTQREQIDLV